MAKRKTIDEKITMRLKMNFSMMVRLNLKLDNIRVCEETVTVMKEYEKIIKCK